MCTSRGVGLGRSLQQWGSGAALLGGLWADQLMGYNGSGEAGMSLALWKLYMSVQAVQWLLMCLSSSAGVGGRACDHLCPRGGQAESTVSPSCMPNSLPSWKILISLLNSSASTRPSTNCSCLPQGDLHHRLQHHWWWSQSPSYQNQEPGQVSANLRLVLVPRPSGQIPAQCGGSCPVSSWVLLADSSLLSC